MEFNATFIVAMFSFVVFILIMNMIFYKPILGIIQKRDDYINNNYNHAKEADKNTNDLNEKYNAEIANSQDECRKEFKSEVENAKNIANDKLNVAKNNTKLTLQEKKNDLISDSNKLKDELDKNTIKNLSDSVVNKLLDFSK